MPLLLLALLHAREAWPAGRGKGDPKSSVVNVNDRSSSSSSSSSRINVNTEINSISMISIVISTIAIIIIRSSSSSSTQRSARGPVDEMHVFQKKVFSPRPEAAFQVNFNAKTHLFNLKCKKTKKRNGCRLGEMHLLSLCSYYTNDFEICSESHVIWNEFEHCFEHLTQVMNKPISSLF